MLATLSGKSRGFLFLRLVVVFGFVLIPLSGCRSSGPTGREPARTGPPIAHTPPPVVAQPTPQRLEEIQSQPVRSEPAPAKPSPITIEVPDRSRWYYVEQYEPTAQPESFQASFNKARNKIDVQTAGVTQFAIDTSRIPIDWERLVVLGIDGRNSELRRRDFDVLHFKRDKYGQWVVVEP